MIVIIVMMMARKHNNNKIAYERIEETEQFTAFIITRLVGYLIADTNDKSTEPQGGRKTPSLLLCSAAASASVCVCVCVARRFSMSIESVTTMASIRR